MSNKFGIATVTAFGAAALYGIVTAYTVGPSKIACDVDGDGTFHIQSIDGQLTKSTAWALSADEKSCIAGGGSSEPIILPRKNLVDSFGNALTQEAPSALYINHYGTAAVKALEEKGQKYINEFKPVR